MSTTNSNGASREERLLDVVAAYVEARDHGEVTDRLQWLARYPEFAAELADFFASASGWKIWPHRERAERAPWRDRRQVLPKRLSLRLVAWFRTGLS